VHEATRIALAAGSSEIFVSVAMLGDPSVRVTTPVSHTVMLKGVNHGERTTHRALDIKFARSAVDGVAVIGLVGMGAMMHGGMIGAREPGGTTAGMMGGSMMGGMMLYMGLTWIVMLGLVGVFIYLIITAGRHANSQT
jgi:hypothetical protein